jgi:hypothetical protein
LSKELLERDPTSSFLFDEFDKPDPVFHSAFYQLFDEGIFEDKNYFVSCTRHHHLHLNYASAQEALEKLGPPYFLRFDAVIGFAPLSARSVGEIAGRSWRCSSGSSRSEEAARSTIPVGRRWRPGSPLRERPPRFRPDGAAFHFQRAVKAAFMMQEEAARGVSYRKRPLAGTERGGKRVDADQCPVSGRSNTKPRPPDAAQMVTVRTAVAAFQSRRPAS